MAVFVDHRQVPCLRVVKELHDLLHRRAYLDFGRCRDHEFGNVETAVQLRTKHDVADVVEQDQPQQHAPLVDYREDIPPRTGNHLHHVAQAHVGNWYRSALLGIAVVTYSDTFARVAFAPLELPVGIFMAILGAPFFLFLLRKEL